MNDLVAWLRVQLDEDERVANSATSGPWDNDDLMTSDAVRAPAVDNWVADCRHEQMGPFAIDNAAHIARHDPARVLAEVSAKRRIIGLVVPPVSARHSETLQILVEDVLRLLALPYADRPGYDEQWGPERCG